MKKIIVFVILFSVLSGINIAFSQINFKKADVFLCKHDGKDIILDQSFTFFDSNFNYENWNSSIESLVKKYMGNKTDKPYYFNKKEKWQKKFTEIKIGEEFYIATPMTTFKSEVIGYKLWNNEPMGYDFNPYLENVESVKEDTVNYDNIFICSKYKDVSTIMTKCVDDKEEFKKVTAFLDEYTKNIVVDPEIGTDDPAEIKVFKANFMNSDRNEYAVSYRKRISFDKFASGIFIVNDIGKVAKTVVDFATEFNYFNLLGVVDCNGDGQYELLGESGYYEGNGYELYKINEEGKYEVIASGFYWGV